MIQPGSYVCTCPVHHHLFEKLWPNMEAHLSNIEERDELPCLCLLHHRDEERDRHKPRLHATQTWSVSNTPPALYTTTNKRNRWHECLLSHCFYCKLQSVTCISNSIVWYILYCIAAVVGLSISREVFWTRECIPSQTQELMHGQTVKFFTNTDLLLQLLYVALLECKHWTWMIRNTTLWVHRSNPKEMYPILQ